MYYHSKLIYVFYFLIFSGKTMGSLQILEHHIKTVHEGVKKFQCTYCPKSFGWREGFKSHIRTVHKGIKFNCDLCEKSFTQKHSLKTHISKAHP